MELSQDWRSFNRIFYSQRTRTSAQGRPSPTGPLQVVVHGDVIDAAYADGEDLSQLVGTSFESFSQQKSFREIIVHQREKVDGWLSTSLSLPNFFEQQEFLRTQSAHSILVQGKRQWNGAQSRFKPHFLLKSLQSWWRRVLPSKYGIFIELQENGRTKERFAMVIRNGTLLGFQEPDLTAFFKHQGQAVATNQRDRDLITQRLLQFLKEKYQVPFFGISAPSADWQNWSRVSSPWLEIFHSLRKKELILSPYSWGVSLMVSLRAYFGV